MMPAGPRRPRSRRNRPCDLCRVRKVACKIDVAPPCQFCVGKGHLCTFDQAPGPRKRPRHNDDGWEAGETRQASVVVVEEPSGQGHGHGHGHGHARPMRAASLPDMEDHALPQALGDAACHVYATQPTTLPVDFSGVSDKRCSTAAESQPSRSLDRSLDPSLEPRLGADHDPLAHLDAAVRYVGPSGDLDPFLLAHRTYDGQHTSVSQYTRAAYHRMRTVADGPHGLLPPAVFTSVVDVSADVDVCTRAADAAYAAEDAAARQQFGRLVDGITASGLIGLFLRFVQPYLPVLSREQLPAYEEGTLAALPVGLLAAVCATALPFVLYDDALCVEAARLPSVDALVGMARAAVAAQAGRPTLATVQTAVLLVVRHGGGGAEDDVWVQCCQMVAAAQLLGLGEDAAGWTALPTWQRRLRRRLWWAVWTTEKWTAFGQGMPSHLSALHDQRDEDKDEHEHEHEHEHDGLPTPETDPDVSPHFAALVRLTTILDDIRDSYFTPRATTRTVENLPEALRAARTFRHRLRAWHHDLPDELRVALQRGRADADARGLPTAELNGHAVLGIAFFTTQLAIFRALIRPISMSHLGTTSGTTGATGTTEMTCTTPGAPPDTPPPSAAMTPQFIAATLTGAMSGLRDLIGFVDRLTTAEWDAFWPGWSRHNFALATTLLMHCYLITSPSNQYQCASEQKHVLRRIPRLVAAPLLSSPPADGSVWAVGGSSPESEWADGRTGLVYGASAALFADIRLLAQKWRWLLRLAARGAAGKKHMVDISLLRIDALFTEWNQVQIGGG